MAVARPAPAPGAALRTAWTRLGHADSTHDQMAGSAPEVEGRSQDDPVAAGLLPSRWGDRRRHLSSAAHRRPSVGNTIN